MSRIYEAGVLSKCLELTSDVSAHIVDRAVGDDSAVIPAAIKHELITEAVGKLTRVVSAVFEACVAAVSAIIELMRAFRLFNLLPILLLAVVAAPGSWGSDSATDELYRIRISNCARGLVQVSLDGGRSYGTVGRVVRPANARITGFSAASFTSRAEVAATAIHGLRIKTGQAALGIEKAQAPMMFSITPLEFAKTPEGFGGHEARHSGIYTDIYAGHSIFRNESPYVGSPVFIERDHDLEPLPEDYTPIEGETFVIIVSRPIEQPSEVDFENRAGGRVIARLPRRAQRTGGEGGAARDGCRALRRNHIHRRGLCEYQPRRRAHHIHRSHMPAWHPGGRARGD